MDMYLKQIFQLTEQVQKEVPQIDCFHDLSQKLYHYRQKNIESHKKLLANHSFYLI